MRAAPPTPPNSGTGYFPAFPLPDDDYPIVLTTGRVLEHWHTGAMSRRAEALSALEPEPVAALNPYQLARWGDRRQ